MRALIFGIVALAACNASPQTSAKVDSTAPPALTSADFPKPDPGDRVRLNNPQAIDGDTVRADDLEVRLYSVDTPEIFSTARCDEEKAAGRVARDFVQSRLDNAQEVVAVVAGEKDKYGRTLAHIEADGADVGAALLANGAAQPYNPGGYDWCPDPGKPVAR
jgi:endonuclease YncB( thermonuclease family)